MDFGFFYFSSGLQPNTEQHHKVDYHHTFSSVPNKILFSLHRIGWASHLQNIVVRDYDTTCFYISTYFADAVNNLLGIAWIVIL